MPESLPLVTVLTPSYNYGSFLGQCLESVRQQTYPNIEHIILDARSTDESSSVIDDFTGTYRMRAIVEKDSGQADALNRGFAIAQGDVFCWLNADDFWLHKWVVEEAILALSVGVDVVSAGGKYVDQHARPLSKIAVLDGELQSLLRCYDPLLQPATFWRRRVHQRLRVNFRYTFDWALFLDMAARGARFSVIDREWAAYRLHNANKSLDDSARRRGEVAQVLRSQWGPWSPQYIWASSVFWGYRAADALHSPRLRSEVRRANDKMGGLTRGRVWSC